MSQTEQPNYYAIIPANVRYDKKLTPNAKLLYAEVTALCNMNGRCTASNQYFADLYGVSIRSIQQWISKLVELGYLSSEITYKAGTKEIESRVLFLPSVPGEEIITTPRKKLHDPHEENFIENNNPTDSNNIYNPDISSLRSDISVPLEKDKPKKAKKEVSPDLLAQFEKWYRYYPLKKSKQPALEKFVKILQNKEATVDELMWGVQCYAEEINLKQTESRYIKHPTTWLNQKCWQDDYEDLFRDIRVEIPDCSQGGY